jgi:hypothetical protein
MNHGLLLPSLSFTHFLSFITDSWREREAKKSLLKMMFDGSALLLHTFLNNKKIDEKKMYARERREEEEVSEVIEKKKVAYNMPSEREREKILYCT